MHHLKAIVVIECFRKIDLYSACLKIWLPATEHHGQVLWVTSVLNESVDLALNTVGHALLSAHQLLLQSQQGSFGQLICFVGRPCNNNQNSNTNSRNNHTHLILFPPSLSPFIPLRLLSFFEMGMVHTYIGLYSNTCRMDRIVVWFSRNTCSAVSHDLRGFWC